jgi:dihydrofolate reductase
MRKIRYQVACSLDGYIAGPDGEYDWIVMDPDIDFKAIFDQFDTLLMGRRTYEVTGAGGYPGMTTLVFSRSLRAEDHPDVTIVSERVKNTLDELRAQGRPFLPAPAVRRRLSLTEQRVYEKSGIVLLKYDVVPEDGSPGRGRSR